MFNWLKEPPDPGWIPFVKLLFGFGLLIILATLSGIIAVKTVHADSSYGLEIILGGLLTLSGGFSQWCFGGDKKDHPAKDAVPPTLP
jgi:hypothetical protein